MWTQSKARSSEIATQAPKPDRCYLMDDIGHILALTVMNSGTEASAMREAATRFRGDPEWPRYRSLGDRAENSAPTTRSGRCPSRYRLRLSSRLPRAGVAHR
jgi:hypothetical protein